MHRRKFACANYKTIFSAWWDRREPKRRTLIVVVLSCLVFGCWRCRRAILFLGEIDENSVWVREMGYNASHASKTSMCVSSTRAVWIPLPAFRFPKSNISVSVLGTSVGGDFDELFTSALERLFCSWIANYCVFKINSVSVVVCSACSSSIGQLKMVDAKNIDASEDWLFLSIEYSEEFNRAMTNRICYLLSLENQFAKSSGVWLNLKFKYCLANSPSVDFWCFQIGFWHKYRRIQIELSLRIVLLIKWRFGIAIIVIG